MEMNQLLTADLLDILFDGRNKGYGAYTLRRNYNRRMGMALLLMTGLLLAFIAGSYIVRGTDDDVMNPFIVTEVKLDQIVPEEPKEELPPPPPPPPAKELMKVELVKYNTVQIVKDNEVQEKDIPPDLETLAEAKIGLISKEGIKDEGIVMPPVSDGERGIVATPGKQVATSSDLPFTKVEIESTYPGGERAWKRYLGKTFRYPSEAAGQEIQGTVVVQFIVDTEGRVSEVVAISGPLEGGLREEAVRVIKRSGNWIPAIQNGRQVKSYKKQPINFVLQLE